jgi:hypothetical protein
MPKPSMKKILLPLLVLLCPAAAFAEQVPVYVYAGQSNMGGYGYSYQLTSPLKDPNPLILAHNCMGRDAAGNPTGQDTGAVTTPEQVDPLTGRWEPYQAGKNGQFHNNNGTYGPELTSLREIQSETGTPVYIVKYALGGTNLYRQWNSRNGGNGQPGELYTGLLAKVQAALDQLQNQLGVQGYVAGFFWMQGEADTFVMPSNFAAAGVTSSDGRAVAYEQNLRNLIADLRQAWGQPNMPFVLGETSDQPPPFKDERQGFGPIVRAAQTQVASDTPWVYIAKATDLAKAADGIHLNSASQQTLGKRFADGYASIVHNGGFEADAGYSGSPKNWEKWTDTSSLEASYGETQSGGHSGAYHGTHWSNQPYRVFTYQYKAGVPNGVYTLSAWVRTGGGQKACSFEISGHGGAKTSVNLATPAIANGQWQKVVIPNISITTGTCTIGFWSDAIAGKWLHFDDVDLKKVN